MTVDLSPIDENLLAEIANMHGMPKGAFNVRKDGELVERHSSAYIDPRVLIHLTAQEVRAVRPLLANNLGSLAIGRIIDEHGTALSHRIIFRLVERITPKVSDGTECLPLVGAHNTLGGIFNHEETVSLCDSHDFVHVAGNTRIMDGHDNSSLFGDGRLNGSRIDILRVG